MKSIINDYRCDYNSKKEIINGLLAEFPFLKKECIGRSVLGKNITALKVGDGPKKILFCGGFHGSEHLTSVILLKFLEEFLFSFKNRSGLKGVNAAISLKERSLVVIPCVNPDGCDISINGNINTEPFSSRIKKLAAGDYTHWNANARGVDINHNFPADWDKIHKLEQESGIFGFAPKRFGGEKAASEPETWALMDYCKKENFRHALAFHSQGEVIYWDFKNLNVKNSRRMAEIMSAVSGYKIETPEPIADGGGFKDWFINEFSRPAFTIELGKGENPLPENEADEIYEKVKEMLMLSLIM